MFSNRKPVVPETAPVHELEDHVIGCGGGDPYIAQLVKEARDAGFPICPRQSEPRRFDVGDFRPPGFEDERD